MFITHFGCAHTHICIYTPHLIVIIHTFMHVLCVCGVWSVCGVLWSVVVYACSVRYGHTYTTQNVYII